MSRHQDPDASEFLEKIKSLEKTAKLLNPAQPQREQWNTQVLDYANNFLDNLDTSKAYNASQNTGEGIYDLDITEAPTELSALLESTTANIDTPALNPASARHMGYIPGGGLYPSALGDFMAAVSNRYAGIFYGAPGAVRLENMLIRWMCRLLDYPDTACGNLTSGGSIANLIAVVTARESHNIKARDVERSVVYLSEQAHHSIQKAFRIAGLSEAQFRYIPLDKGLRLRPEALEQAILEDKANGLQPFFINASFGTTNTGSIDPMAPIAAIAQRHNLWFHVDAAYGGFFKLVPELKEKFKGIEQADSITLDPHKTLFLPFGTGTVLIKNKEKVIKAYYWLADYMQDTEGTSLEVSPADVSPELTKHFRGMRLWLPLKLFGVKPFRAALEEKLYLARYFYHQINQMDQFESGPEPELSVAMFRYLPTAGDANAFNERLIRAIQTDGRVFLSSTTVNGVFWIRVAIVVFRTHLKQIDLLLGVIKEQVGVIDIK